MNIKRQDLAVRHQDFLLRMRAQAWSQKMASQIVGYALFALQLYVLANTLSYIGMHSSALTPLYGLLILMHLGSLPFLFGVNNKWIMRAGGICAWLMAAFYFWNGFYDMLHIIAGTVYIAGLAFITFARPSAVIWR